MYWYSWRDQLSTKTGTDPVVVITNKCTNINKVQLIHKYVFNFLSRVRPNKDWFTDFFYNRQENSLGKTLSKYTAKSEEMIYPSPIPCSASL